MPTLEVDALNHPRHSMPPMAATREHFTQMIFRTIIVLVGDYSQRYGAVLQELLGEQVEIRFVKTFDASFDLVVDPRVAAVILDCNTADQDPRGAFRELKAAGYSAPIITMLSRQNADDHLVFLAAGAAGVFCWPFDISQLALRCRELTELKAAEKPKEARVGTLRLDLESTEIYCGSKALKLQPRQRDLLSALLLYGNRVCPREYLASTFRQEKSKAIANALDRSISRLRTTFQELQIDVEIRTVRGLGYMLRPAPAAV
jgi:DNA-binding response OmpR family regulator